VLFTGTYERTLDGKGRVLLPKRMRSILLQSQVLFLTPGTDQCLELHTSESLEKLALKASESASNSRTVQSFSRLFYAQAEQIELDPQGRMRIPARLVEWAGLDKEIAIIGVGFNWEIWQNELWQAYYQSQVDEFDGVHHSTFDSHQEVKETITNHIHAK
jgi:MraZ protein